MTKKFCTLFDNIWQVVQDRLALIAAQKLQFTVERLKKCLEPHFQPTTKYYG